MKIQRFRRIVLALGIFLAISATVLTATGAIIIIGNALTFNPQPKPVILMTSNSTSTPYVGDTIHLTATVSPANPGIVITFNLNSVSMGTATTNPQGIATYDYVVPSTTPFTIYPSATF